MIYETPMLLELDKLYSKSDGDKDKLAGISGNIGCWKCGNDMV